MTFPSANQIQHGILIRGLVCMMQAALGSSAVGQFSHESKRASHEAQLFCLDVP